MEMTGGEYATVIGDASQQQQQQHRHHHPTQHIASGQRPGYYTMLKTIKTLFFSDHKTTFYFLTITLLIVYRFSYFCSNIRDKICNKT